MATKEYSQDLVVDGKVTQSGTPSAPGDLVTKSALDTAIAGVGGGGSATVLPFNLADEEKSPALAFLVPGPDDKPTITSADNQEFGSTSVTGGSPASHIPARVGGTNAGNLDMVNDTKFRYLGFKANLAVAPIASWADYLQPPFKTGGSSQFSYWTWAVEFETDATQIDFRFKDVGGGENFVFLVNGRPVSGDLEYTATVTGGARYGVKLTFPNARMRRIQMRSNGDVGWGGIWTNTSATVRKSPESPSRRMAFIGDSITGGAVSVNGIWSTYAPRLAHMLGIDEPILQGIGGTGWNSASTASFGGDRLTEVLAMAPQAIIFTGSVNDSGVATATTAAAVTAAMNACNAANIPFVAVAGSHLTTHSAMNTAIKNAVEAAGRTYIDIAMFEPSDSLNIFFEGGAQVHPTALGHKRLAQRWWTQLNGIFQVQTSADIGLKMSELPVLTASGLFATTKIGVLDPTNLTMGPSGSNAATQLTELMKRLGPVINTSVANQTGLAADTYLVGSNVLIPGGGRLQAKSIYRCKFNVAKTAAGTATPIIQVRIGTAGAIGDTSRATLTFPAQTAAIDDGFFDLVVIFRTVGSGTTAVIQATANLVHRLSITGLANIVSPTVTVTSGGFDSTVANLQIGLSVNGGASAAWTITSVVAELSNLA